MSTVNAVFTRNTLTDASIFFSEVADATVSDNAFIRSGLTLGISDKSTVRHNRFSGADVGVFLQDDTDNIQLVDNRFEDNRIGTQVDALQAATLYGTVISGNTYRHNRAAGLLFQVRLGGCDNCPQITSNTFADNGFAPAGLVDRLGSPVADGLHVSVPGHTPLLVADNTTRRNAAYGIFAPADTVTDGGAFPRHRHNR